jgi:tRNA(Ile)-lysidine synthase
LDGEYRLDIPGNTDIPGWRVVAAVRKPSSTSAEGFNACIDLDKAGSNMFVRHRRSGDHFQPLGMDAVKKLQDFMVDARIPRHWRDNVPLVCSSEGILWVVGWRIADWVKVTDRTKRTLLLEFERV